MKLTKDIELIDLAVYLPKHKTIILGDTHIGYEQDLINKGLLVPKTYFKDMMRRIKDIFVKVEVETVIFNGDIKHEFGIISEQEWRDTLELWNFLEKNSKKIILIKGNHDKTLGPLAKKKDLQVKDYIIIDDIFITHGHEIHKIPKEIKTIIIAHEHPAIELEETGRREKFKCFLAGSLKLEISNSCESSIRKKYKKFKLIVQPSLFLLTEGTDILRENLLSPYLKNINNFEVYIVGDKIYNFGKLKNLK